MPRPSPPPVAEIGDASFDEFAAGQGSEGLHLFRSRGVITLAPWLVGEFDGPGPPPGWSVEVLAEGGGATFAEGGVLLDGAGIYADELVSNDRAVEFSATFARRRDQHGGLAINFVENAWVSFGTKFGNALYARTRFFMAEDERISADLLGSPHRYRIDWNVIDIVYSVDGNRATHLLVPVPAFLRAGVASTSLGGDPLRLDWMVITPYRPSGRFESRVFDAGGAARWYEVTWDAELPASTAVAVAVRAGEVPEPDATWSQWAAVEDSGSDLDVTGRYAQYCVEMTTGDPRQTPVLRSVQLRYGT